MASPEVTENQQKQATEPREVNNLPENVNKGSLDAKGLFVNRMEARVKADGEDQKNLDTDQKVLKLIQDSEKNGTRDQLNGKTACDALDKPPGTLTPEQKARVYKDLNDPHMGVDNEVSQYKQDLAKGKFTGGCTGDGAINAINGDRKHDGKPELTKEEENRVRQDMGDKGAKPTAPENSPNSKQMEEMVKHEQENAKYSGLDDKVAHLARNSNGDINGRQMCDQIDQERVKNHEQPLNPEERSRVYKDLSDPNQKVDNELAQVIKDNQELHRQGVLTAPSAIEAINKERQDKHETPLNPEEERRVWQDMGLQPPADKSIQIADAQQPNQPVVESTTTNAYENRYKATDDYVNKFPENKTADDIIKTYEQQTGRSMPEEMQKRVHHLRPTPEGES